MPPCRGRSAVGAQQGGLRYHERILRPPTLVGLVGLGAGAFVVRSGGGMVSPTHGSYQAVGILVVAGTRLNWGFEDFAIAAGTDLMPAAASGGGGSPSSSSSPRC